jgi:hypothetical protein
MASKDLHHNVKQVVALTSQTIDSDTDTYGEDIDMTGFESLEIVLLSGTITDGAYAVSLVHGDSATPTDDVPADEQLGDADFALADDDTAKRIGYIGKKKIVRVKITSTSTTDGGLFAGVAVQGHPHHAPVAD